MAAKKTVERGYGANHKRLRRLWAPRVAAAYVACARVGRLIMPGEAWDLGHVDGDRSQYAGPEHRRCNRSTASRRPNRRRRTVPIDDPDAGVFWGATGRDRQSPALVASLVRVARELMTQAGLVQVWLGLRTTRQVFAKKIELRRKDRREINTEMRWLSGKDVGEADVQRIPR
jgi:hypothetical protein